MFARTLQNLATKILSFWDKLYDSKDNCIKAVNRIGDALADEFAAYSEAEGRHEHGPYPLVDYIDIDGDVIGWQNTYHEENGYNGSPNWRKFRVIVR